MPKCVVVDPAFTWGDDRSPNTPWNRTVIYECHVRGMTMRHPGVPEHLRGTYLGLASDPIIDHLVGLGVTAVELMPAHQFVADRHLVERGLTNYWGYNSIAYLAPHVGYATGGLGEQVSEFKSMVRTLHRAGLEVILDVVYNHTGEGNHLGPTLVPAGHRQRRLLPAEPRGPPVPRRLHRDGQQPEHPASTGHGPHHGQPPLLGDRHARGRLPLRPCPGAGPRLRGRTAQCLLRDHPAGPGALQGEAHRRAVGRRPRRLPAGPVPARLVGVERRLPGLRPALLARGPGTGPRAGLPPHRLQRHLRPQWSPHVRQHQLRHLPRRLHPDRPGQLRAQPQRGQRGGQPRRCPGEPQPELGGGGALSLRSGSNGPGTG